MSRSYLDVHILSEETVVRRSRAVCTGYVTGRVGSPVPYGMERAAVSYSNRFRTALMNGKHVPDEPTFKEAAGGLTRADIAEMNRLLFAVLDESLDEMLVKLADAAVLWSPKALDRIAGLRGGI